MNETNTQRRKFLKTSAKIGGTLLASTAAIPLFTEAKNLDSGTITNSTNLNPSDIFAINEALAKGAPIPARGYAVADKASKFKPFKFSRHPLGANDILIEILYSGVCHSDIHSARSEWGEGIYPMVTGHEIAGKVIAVGSKVSKFKLGDSAGVGCMVNSCGECEACKRSEEQFCQNAKTVYTYNSKDVFHDNAPTYGGYSNNIVVRENFAIKIPAQADLAKVAPLLCAGITTYSPIRYSKVSRGQNVAVAGVGRAWTPST